VGELALCELCAVRAQAAEASAAREAARLRVELGATAERLLETERRAEAAQRESEAGALALRDELARARSSRAEAVHEARDEARREWRQRVATLQGELTSEMAALAVLPPPAPYPSSVPASLSSLPPPHEAHQLQLGQTARSPVSASFETGPGPGSPEYHARVPRPALASAGYGRLLTPPRQERPAWQD